MAIAALKLHWYCSQPACFRYSRYSSHSSTRYSANYTTLPTILLYCTYHEQIGHLLRRHRADRAEFLRNRDRTIADFALAGLQRHPVAFVLDNVRSAYNVGGMFRTADTAS